MAEMPKPSCLIVAGHILADLDIFVRFLPPPPPWHCRQQGVGILRLVNAAESPRISETRPTLAPAYLTALFALIPDGMLGNLIRR